MSGSRGSSFRGDLNIISSGAASFREALVRTSLQIQRFQIFIWKQGIGIICKILYCCFGKSTLQVV